MPTISKVLIKLIKILNRLKVSYMVVGGFAVNYYGLPRATVDIDLAISVDPKSIKNLLTALRKEKYIFSQNEVTTLIKISNHFIIFDPSNTYRIDCWIPKTNFELQALNRRIKTKTAGISIYLPTAEDLVLFKLSAGREKDKEDLKWIINRQKETVDKKHLKFWSIALNIHRDLSKFIKV